MGANSLALPYHRMIGCASSETLTVAPVLRPDSWCWQSMCLSLATGPGPVSNARRLFQLRRLRSCHGDNISHRQQFAASQPEGISPGHRGGPGLGLGLAWTWASPLRADGQHRARWVSPGGYGLMPSLQASLPAACVVNGGFGVELHLHYSVLLPRMKLEACVTSNSNSGHQSKTRGERGIARHDPSTGWQTGTKVAPGTDQTCRLVVRNAQGSSR